MSYSKASARTPIPKHRTRRSKALKPEALVSTTSPDPFLMLHVEG